MEDDECIASLCLSLQKQLCNRSMMVLMLHNCVISRTIK